MNLSEMSLQQIWEIIEKYSPRKVIVTKEDFINLWGRFPPDNRLRAGVTGMEQKPAILVNGVVIEPDKWSSKERKGVLDLTKESPQYKKQE